MTPDLRHPLQSHMLRVFGNIILLHALMLAKGSHRGTAPVPPQKMPYSSMA